MIKKGYYSDNRNSDEKPEVKKKGGFMVRIFGDYLEVLKLKPFRWLLLTGFLFLSVNSLVGADRMYYMTYNLNLSGGEATLALLTVPMFGAIFIPLISSMGKRMDKRLTYITLCGTSAVLMLTGSTLAIDTKIGMAAYMAVYTLGNTAYWQMVPAMVYDICEVDELYNGKQRAGVLSSMQSIVETVSAAASVQAFGIILKLSGFDSSLHVQSVTALRAITHSLTIILIVLMVLSVVAMFCYPVTRKKFEEIQEELRARRSR